MQNRVSCRALSAVSIFAASGGALAGPPTFTGLGDVAPGTINSLAQAVSADGLVVTGRCTPSNFQRVCRWTAAGGMVSLSGPNFAIGTGISADGSAIVGYNANLSGDVQAFRWTSAGFEALLAIGSQSPGPRAFAVSADGSIAVGESNTPLSAVAVFWVTGGAPTPLSNEPGFSFSSASGISADGVTIVGNGSSFDLGNVPFRWTLAGGMVALPDLPGGTVSAAANAISGDGSTIVGYGNSDSGQEATIWVADVPTGLGDLAGGTFESSALAVSSDGSVVVGYATTDIGQEAFIWDAAHGMRSILAELNNRGVAAVTGWKLQQATGVSADGTVIVGNGISPNGETEAWIASFPVAAPCFANCDNSTVVPVLNAQDFLCFLNLYASADPAANCDQSTSPPTLNVLDFVCFMNAFAVGCP